MNRLQRTVAVDWWFQATVDQINNNLEQTDDLQAAMVATIQFAADYIHELDISLNNDLYQGRFDDIAENLYRIDMMLRDILRAMDRRSTQLPVNGRYLALIATIDTDRRMINLGTGQIWAEDSQDLQTTYLNRSREFLRHQNTRMVANLLAERVLTPILPPEVRDVVRSWIVGYLEEDEDIGEDDDDEGEDYDDDDGLG